MKKTIILVIFLLLVMNATALGTFKYTSHSYTVDAFKDFNGSDFLLADGSNAALINTSLVNTCVSGEYSWYNGSVFLCSEDLQGSGTFSYDTYFDQYLNTTNGVEFSSVFVNGNANVTGDFTIHGGHIYLKSADDDAAPYIRADDTHGQGNINTTGGTILHTVANNPSRIMLGVWNDDTNGAHIPRLVVQSGGVGLANFFTGSVAILDRNVSWLNGSVNDGVITNMTRWHEYEGVEQKIDYASDLSGADLLVGDDLQVGGDMYYTDTSGEYHFATREATLRDMLTSDTVESRLFSNVSVDGVDYFTSDGLSIFVNIDETTIIKSSNTDSISFVKGTNTSPQLNQLYYNTSGNLSVATSRSENRAETGVAIVGDGKIFASTIGSQNVDEFVRGMYQWTLDQGVTYKSGFTPSVSPEQINISTGTYKVSIRQFTNSQNHTSNDFFIVNSTGNYVQCTDLDCITQYGDGSSIGNNRNFNLVCGIIHVQLGDNVLAPGNMHCIVQDQPGTEYANVVDAEVDEFSKTRFFPQIDTLKQSFVPVTRVVVQRSGGVNTIQELKDGTLFIDLRGTLGGGGGSPPSPSITDFNDLDNIPTHLSNFTDDLGHVEDNTSWNQSGYWDNASNSFYPLDSNPSGYLTSYTETDPVWESDRPNYVNETRYAVLNASLCQSDGTNCVSGGNSSFNQSLTDSLYLSNSGDSATGTYTFDTNTLHIDSVNNEVGIGTTNPSGKLEIVNDNAVLSDLDAIFSRYGSGGATFIARASSGTEASPTGTQNGNNILVFQGRGHDGTNWITGAQARIRILADGDTNSTNRGMYMTFDTTDLGSTSRTDGVLTVRNSNVGIGTTSPSEKLNVQGGSVLVESDIDVDVNANVIVKRLNESGGLSGKPVALSSGLFGGLFLFDETGTFLIRSQDNQSILQGLASGSTVRLAVDGTTGNVGIGVSSPNAKLDVAGDIELTGSVIPDNTCGIPSGLIWAEEAAALSTSTNGGLQFSYGNGNTAAHGIVQACSGTVTALTMNCEASASTAGVVQVAVNGTAQGSGCQVSSPGSNNGNTVDNSCSVSFGATDALTFITTTSDATSNGCTATMYVRYD